MRNRLKFIMLFFMVIWSFLDIVRCVYNGIFVFKNTKLNSKKPRILQMAGYYCNLAKHS